MSGLGITVALGLVIVAATIWMIRQHSEASRNVPFVAGPLGALVAVGCGIAALYLFLSPFASRLPSASDVLGYTAAATQTATALLPVSTPTPTAAPPTPAVVATPEFTPYWVRNHRRTQMWSGRAGPPNIVSFGVTSNQFCVFEVVRQQDNARLYVLNPYDQNYFWIDANDVGPIPEPPEHKPGPKPPGLNCADALYEG
jgi:hypothetical protein